jgi:hypothetical protein
VLRHHLAIRSSLGSSNSAALVSYTNKLTLRRGQSTSHTTNVGVSPNPSPLTPAPWSHEYPGQRQRIRRIPRNRDDDAQIAHATLIPAPNTPYNHRQHERLASLHHNPATAALNLLLRVVLLRSVECIPQWPPTTLDEPHGSLQPLLVLWRRNLKLPRPCAHGHQRLVRHPAAQVQEQEQPVHNG